jgi:hypothetical protein
VNTDARELTDSEIYAREALGAEFDAKRGKNGSHRYDRRQPFGGLSESDVELLVARVSQRVIQSFYQELGRTVVTRVLQVLGVLTTGVVVWLAGGKFNWWRMP